MMSIVTAASPTPRLPSVTPTFKLMRPGPSSRPGGLSLLRERVRNERKGQQAVSRATLPSIPTSRGSTVLRARRRLLPESESTCYRLPHRLSWRP